MRNFLLLLICLFPVVDEALAQKFEAHLQIGVNASQIDGDALVGYNKPGFLVGPIVCFPFTEVFALQTGILYSQKGSRYGKNDPNNFIQRLNYIELPLAAKFHTFEQVDFVGGITANYLINAKSDDGTGFAENSSGFENFDVCYVAAVNYAPFERTSFQIRFVNSLANIREDRFFKNRTLSFSVLFCLLKP